MNIIIPYRDEYPEQRRAAQLETFLEYMKKYCDARIYIAEQMNDGRLFNRGALLNAAYKYIDRPEDTYIFHDVDLLPDEDLKSYYLEPPPRGKVYHIASSWRRYDSSSYFGGIVSMRGIDFERTGGFPPNYWGWGGEDDELRARVLRCGLKIERARGGSITDLENMNLAEKLEYLKRNGLKNKDKKALRHARDGAGLSETNYRVTAARDIGSGVTHLTIEIL